ncbi:prolyl oligopeptidase family serine peptidase [uncultured Aquimarina sp.]|uniref:prolyl oligopeptidase family serine peptidase n=1 Tax=uncultured Aquimarina sp. TaxID=575652 RepID=UPI002607B3BB|nr:prolyl oligopeptidase family serine peptidase [uncultured Aquimarina sp.]
MINKCLIVLFISIILLGCKKSMNILPEQKFKENYFGETIEDPYRYAENLNNSAVQKWIKNQSVIAENLLDKIHKRQYLIEEQTNSDEKNEFVISKLKVLENDKYFYLKRLSNENVPKLYYRKAFSEKEQLLYDPKDFRSDSGIEYVINYIRPNWDGSKVVVSLTSKGKEISELLIVDVSSGKVHPEILENAWPSAAGGIQWLPDNKGFVYVYHPVTDPKAKGFLKNMQSVVYRLGDKPEILKVILSKELNSELAINEEDFPVISIENPDAQYILGKLTGAYSYYDAYYKSINNISSKEWKPLFTKSDKVKSIKISGDSVVYRTAKDAPNFKICMTSLINPDFKNPQVLVEEYKDKVITDFELTSEGLYFVTNTNGVKADLYKLDNATIEAVQLPQVYGNISISSLGATHPELWINARGWITNNKRYLYTSEGLINQSLQEDVHNDKLDNIVVEEIEVTARDGEKIPLSLIYNKDLVKNAKNRVMMDGYGSYGISMKPGFSLRRLLWVMEGGVYAIAHVRGGGEKGDAWHKRGYKATKSNTWNDFIDCAEFLIDRKYTNPDQLAIWSGSAGGIMIGRAITERPDLFGTAIVEFGSLNMLRSEMRANGANNVKEFGTIKDSLGFKNLLEMDAYHHIKDKEDYPATLLTVGLNDPRVPAWFSVKFGARIQAANTSEKPNFLLANSEAGHAQDDTKLIEFTRFANILSFALWQTGHPEYQPEN